MRAILLALVGFSLTALPAAEPTSPKEPPAEPARIELQIAPTDPGHESKLVLQLKPAEGIKINRYPKIKLKIPAKPGLVEAAEVEVGNPAPPPPDQIQANYFKTVDPVELTLRVDAQARAGLYQLPAQLSYYYCVAASGFCAPKKASLLIPLSVR